VTSHDYEKEQRLLDGILNLAAGISCLPLPSIGRGMDKRIIQKYDVRMNRTVLPLTLQRSCIVVVHHLYITTGTSLALTVTRLVDCFSRLFCWFPEYLRLQLKGSIYHILTPVRTSRSIPLTNVSMELNIRRAIKIPQNVCCH
jgi:hypothetical protein